MTIGAPGNALPDRDAPIVVDLDGTLSRTDTLLESTIRAIKRDILNLPKALLYLVKGRPTFKQFVASQAALSAKDLPYHADLLDYLRQERQRGRRIVLATAADRSIANAVASHIGLFDKVLSTEVGVNLKGATKLNMILKVVGSRFVYAGDSSADLIIWRHAQAAILVGTTPILRSAVCRTTRIENEFTGEAATLRTWLRALRVHQWLKNLLVFVPLFTGFSFFDASKLVATAAAFVAFSLAASATYVLNDLLDLDSDRIHPQKRNRPFAAAQIPILDGLLVAAGTLALGLGLAASVSSAFLLIILLYLGLASLYSLKLKRYVLLDTLILSLLYTLRVVAGAIAANVPMSNWLLAFCMFIFLSLALVKRCSELVSLQRAGVTSAAGRGYQVTDMIVLWPLGVGAALCSIVVFGLFIDDTETAIRYTSPQLLWLVAFLLTYWVSRLWIKSARGELDDDPVVYAVRDRTSRTTMLVIVVTMLLARFTDIVP
jgi:4-hydroxybenzoate polyprenyltransferase/phosphoserine phosphatase